MFAHVAIAGAAITQVTGLVKRETCLSDMTADDVLGAGPHIATFAADSAKEWIVTIVGFSGP